MSEKPSKIARRLSKTTLALSDPPRRAKVEIKETEEANIMQVSTPIAQRIEKLYCKSPDEHIKRQSTLNEKNPVRLQYDRGVSDTTALRPKGNTKRRPYSSVDEGRTEGVTIQMRNGEVLMFNDNSETFEMHKGNTVRKKFTPEVKTKSLPRKGNSLRSMMKELEKESQYQKEESNEKDNQSQKGESNEILKYDEEGITVNNNIHSNNVSNSQCNQEDDKLSEISNNVETSNDSVLKNIENIHSMYHLDCNKEDVNRTNNNITTEHTETSDGTDKYVSMSNDSDLEGNDKSPSLVGNEKEDTDNNNSVDNYASFKKGKYAAPGPAMRKIDKYRESLRKRKKENRSLSEPFSDEVSYTPKPEVSCEAEAMTGSPVRSVSTSSEPEGKPRRYYSKHADRSSSRANRYVVKSTPVARSNSLGNLYFGGMDEIPKGIAKSKIMEIQKRVEQNDVKDIRERLIKGSTWFSNPTTPRAQSPTGSGTTSPQYRTLSPTGSTVSSVADTLNTSPRYRTLSPTSGTVSAIASKYDSLSSKNLNDSGPFSPITKKDAITILSNTLPRNFSSAKSAREEKSNMMSPRNKIPDESVEPAQCNDQSEEGIFTFPKPAPRIKSHASHKTSNQSNAEKVSATSSSSSSVYNTQSSGEEVSDITVTPKRPARGVKRSSREIASNDKSNTVVGNDQSMKRNSKVPYEQVMPSRKVRMGVNSFKRKGPAPKPPTQKAAGPSLNRQNELDLPEVFSKVEDMLDEENDLMGAFKFVQGKSEPSEEGDRNESSDTYVPTLNLAGVTEDSSTDYESVESKKQNDSGKSKDSKEPIYADIDIVDTKTEENLNSMDSFILPAPIDFSDMADIVKNENFPVYATVDKANNKKKEEENAAPIPPPRLKKSASGDGKKFNLDFNANSYRKNSSADISESQTSSDTADPPSTTSIEDDSDDTLVQNEAGHTSSDYSSSEDMLDDNYDPLYETIRNVKTKRNKRLTKVVHFEEETVDIIVTDTDNNSQADAFISRNTSETISYPLSYIQQNDTYSLQKLSGKSKKEKKKSKKRSQSASPKRVFDTLRNSSDEDLLEERSRKRTLSPTSVLKDTVKKMLRVRPSSPKERNEKLLSTHEPSYSSSQTSKKGILTNQKSTPSSALPGEHNGITLISITKTGHMDRQQSQPTNNSGFNVYRYAGPGGAKAVTRASKSMGDIYEGMGKLKTNDLADLQVIHVDSDTSDNNQRKLPATPKEKRLPILVKVVGKDEDTECQYSGCPFDHIQAVKICHHNDCQEENEQRPLMLCSSCDDTIHSDPSLSAHRRFDIYKKGGTLNRNVSTRSLPGLSQSDDEGGGAEAADDDDNDAKKTNSKLKRKKVLKKRYHTDDSVSNPTVVHMRSKSLQEYELSANMTKPRTGGDMTKKSLNQSETALQNAVVMEDRDGESRSNSIGSHQESQESVFADTETDLTNQGLDEVPCEKLSENVHNKSSESMQDVDGEDYDDEFSSILNSSPVSGDGTTNSSTQSAFRKLDHSKTTGNTDDRAVLAGKDQVDSGSAKTKPKSKIPNRKSKDDQSRRSQSSLFTMGMEYFTLKFDVLDNPEVCEIVAAVKGVSLKDAIASSLDKRGINVNAVDIFLASSNTPLPLHVDCFPLGGNHLHVKAKDNDQVSRFNRSVSSNSLSNVKLKQSMVPRPKQVQSQRSKKGVIDDNGITVTDVSPHGTLTNSDTGRMNKTTRPTTKLTSLFSPFAKNKHEALQQQLDNYSHDGLPGMPALLTMGKPDYDESVFTIERHWSDVVGTSPEELTKKQRDQQETIWELLHTEVEHIRKLKVIIDLYLSCLMDLQNETLLNDVKTEDVFSNIVEVCECNQTFWDTHLRPVLEHSRKTKELLDPSLLKEGFMKFEDIFKPYAKYCLEQKACLDYIKAKQGENELFRTFIEWGEAQKQCNRLKLLDLIIIPMQRLTKYKLLILAILKKTEKEEHRKDLIHMVEKVERFVIQVNQVMHQRAEHERLSMIIERIEAYDVIDAPNIEEVQRLSSDFCKLDLTCPVPGCGPQQRRHLLLEGGLKFREANSRLDVYCFLFTDMLLVTKPNKRADKVKVTKPPMRLDKCVVQLLKDNASFMLVYLNEYHVASGVYTFHGESAKIWVDHVRRAQDGYKHLRKQALEKSENRMYWEMFYEENYEDDLAVMNSKHNNSDMADRQDSSNSAEAFMPNIDTIQRSSSHGTLRFDPVNQDTRRLRISSSLDENRVAQQHNNAALRDSVQRSDSEPIRPNLSLPRHSISDYHITGEQAHIESPTSSSMSRSSLQPDVYYARAPKSRTSSSSNNGSRLDSQSSIEGQLVRPAYRGHRDLPERPKSITDGPEHNKSKLNQRRTRNEKRYHTADAIQELRKDNRDTSIHKRLSWNLGTHTVDINIDDRQGYLKNKTFSSDSIKSMPSSSGVSSTGSLHLSPESEICEEYEDDDDDSALMSQHIITPNTEQTISFDDSNQSDSSTNESSATLTAEQTPVVMRGDNPASESESSSGTSANGDVSSSANSSSKSLSDISHISIKDVKEGVGSAEVKGGKKMGHKELRYMKKQLLLNSTLEASEV